MIAISFTLGVPVQLNVAVAPSKIEAVNELLEI